MCTAATSASWSAASSTPPGSLPSVPQAQSAAPQVRPSTGLKALLALLRPFASRKAGRKVVAVESLTGIEAATRCRAPPPAPCPPPCCSTAAAPPS